MRRLAIRRGRASRSAPARGRPGSPGGPRAPIVLAAALLALSGCASTPPPCELSTPGAPWLAFASLRTGRHAIWRARADGTCLEQVTRSTGTDLYPSWTGRTVAFASDRSGALRLWTHDLATGAEAMRDTGTLDAATAPAFSPDGAAIAFEGRAAGSLTSDVYVVPAAGGAIVPLAADPADDAGPAWAPDGLTVYFVSTRSGAYEVWSVPAAGGTAVQVTTGSRIVGKPAVAVDGASIFYARTVAGGSATEVVRQDLAGGAIAVVSSQDDSEPALGPSGRHLALRSFRGGSADIVVAALDGTGPLFVTSDVASDGAPAFARGL